MYCFDSSILIDFLRNDAEIVEKVKIISQKSEIFTTIINLSELYKGVYLSPNSETQLEILENFMGSFNILYLDKNSAKLFGEIYGSLKSTGTQIPEFDLMIASIAKINNLTLITRDKKHFKHTGVKLEVW